MGRYCSEALSETMHDQVDQNLSAGEYDRLHTIVWLTTEADSDNQSFSTSHYITVF